MTEIAVPPAIKKTHAGLQYTITFRPNDSHIYLDIDELGLDNHEVHTACEAKAWKDLEKEGDKAAATIIDLHNSAPKGLL